MKILHFNYSDQLGGSGVAIMRLHEALKKYHKIDSLIKVNEKSSSANDVLGPLNSLDMSLNLLKTRFSYQLKKFSKIDSSATHSVALLPSSTKKIIKNIDPDIVHLHWINNEMMSIREIGQIQKPLLWTFVDMWPVCGSEHYTFEDNFLNGYNDKSINNSQRFDLNKWVWKRKKKHWVNNKFKIVCISNWLTNLVQKSLLFKDFDVSTIPPCIEEKKWTPLDKNASRKILEIDENIPVLLFSAANGTKEKRKGFDFLLKILDDPFYINNKCKLIIIGKLDQEHKKKLKIDYINFADNYSNNSLLLRILYSSSDLILAPDILATFNQVVLEANSCQTPAISFSNTGTSDIIEHKNTGYLSKFNDAEDLNNGIKWCLKEIKNNNYLGINARERVKNLFSSEKISSRYTSVYDELIKK
jgi:glycosyltransferase involved in cell wall biosynthesis